MKRGCRRIKDENGLFRSGAQPTTCHTQAKIPSRSVKRHAKHYVVGVALTQGSRSVHCIVIRQLGVLVAAVCHSPFPFVPCAAEVGHENAREKGEGLERLEGSAGPSTGKHSARFRVFIPLLVPGGYGNTAGAAITRTGDEMFLISCALYTLVRYVGRGWEGAHFNVLARDYRIWSGYPFYA